MNDLDLLLSYVAGDLSTGDAAAFEARLAADADLAAEVKAQRLAVAALATAPPVTLADSERAELRRSVAAGLGVDAASVPAPPQRRRSWAPLAAVAGAAAVVVAGLVVVPAMLGGGEDAAGRFDTTLGAADMATTVAQDGAIAESSGEAPAETTTTVAASAEAPLVPMLDEDFDLSRLLEESSIARDDATSGAMVAIDLAQIEGCLDTLAAELPGAADFVVVAVAEKAGSRVLLLTYTDSDGSLGAAAIDATTCRLVESTGVGSDEGSG